MESKLLKLAKYLELGESVIAFHGVLLPLFLFLIIALSGCVWFADNRIPVKPKPIDTTSPEFLRALSLIIKGRYETKMSANEILRWMEADMALQEYLLTKDNEEAVVANPKSPEF